MTGLPPTPLPPGLSGDGGEEHDASTPSREGAPHDLRRADAPLARLWWALPAAALLVLMVWALLFGSGPEQRQHGSSYDASPRGFRAAYLLLDELGFPVTRSRRLGDAFANLGRGGYGVRWVLFPTKSTAKDVALLDHWIRQGGVLLLADNGQEFARHLGIDLEFKDRPEGEEQGSGLGLGRLAGGKTWVLWPGQAGEVLVDIAGAAVVTRYARDEGAIWLVNRPELMTNELLKKADNGAFVCRLAEAMLQDSPGHIAFDEYFHGMRDRPGVTQLLLEPPALWGTCQALLLSAVVLWHYVPRFGSVAPARQSSRRSKEEFLGAMAALLERKRDYRAAFLTVQADFCRELEQALALPAGTPAARIVLEAAQRRPIDQQMLLRLLTVFSSGASGMTPFSDRLFVKSMNELETARDQFFAKR